MKSSIKENPNKSLEFPVLMRHRLEGYIVMFTALTEGTIVANPTVRNESYSLGAFTPDWVTATNTGIWEYFEGEITLSN